MSANLPYHQISCFGIERVIQASEFVLLFYDPSFSSINLDVLIFACYFFRVAQKHSELFLDV